MNHRSTSWQRLARRRTLGMRERGVPAKSRPRCLAAPRRAGEAPWHGPDIDTGGFLRMGYDIWGPSGTPTAPSPLLWRPHVTHDICQIYKFNSDVLNVRRKAQGTNRDVRGSSKETTREGWSHGRDARGERRNDQTARSAAAKCFAACRRRRPRPSGDPFGSRARGTAAPESDSLITAGVARKSETPPSRRRMRSGRMAESNACGSRSRSSRRVCTPTASEAISREGKVQTQP